MRLARMFLVAATAAACVGVAAPAAHAQCVPSQGTCVVDIIPHGAPCTRVEAGAFDICILP